MCAAPMIWNDEKRECQESMRDICPDSWVAKDNICIEPVAAITIDGCEFEALLRGKNDEGTVEEHNVCI